MIKMTEDKVFEFLREVRKLAEERGIEHLFVIAENHSVTNNDGTNEAIRRCRETLKNYEREVGSDPEEHWT